jgi:hypothetical protein
LLSFLFSEYAFANDSSSSFVFSLPPAGAEPEEEDNEEDDNDENSYNLYDQEEDIEEEDVEMARVPAAAALPVGQGSGRVAAGQDTAARRSPPQAVAGVDALLAGMANVQVADRPFQAFNFDAAYCSILAEMQSMSATGCQNVIGTFLIPNTHKTDVSVQVSADKW